MQKESKIFFAIILGAIIIGVFVYLGLHNDGFLPYGKNPYTTPAPTPKVGGTSDVTPTVKTTEVRPPIATNTGSLQSICGAEENTIVTKVIDGDTVVVEGGWHVRLLGMDADEKGYPCYDPARLRLESLVLGKNVKLEKDKTNVDQYGRYLRYIFLGKENVDVQLVKEGLAVARFYQPDVKYRTEIAEAEKLAQTGKIGCKWQSPQNQ